MNVLILLVALQGGLQFYGDISTNNPAAIYLPLSILIIAGMV
jgi:hypothetical protein